MKGIWIALWVVLAALLVLVVMNPPDPDSRQTLTANPTIALPAFQPNAKAAAEVRPGGAPGAIVCDDFPTIRMISELYSKHWEDGAQDAMTDGQAHILRGPSTPMPEPELYGCSLLPPGTPVQIVTGAVRIVCADSNGSVRPPRAGTDICDVGNLAFQETAGKLEDGGFIKEVIAKRPDGRWIYGVTLPDMLSGM